MNRDTKDTKKTIAILTILALIGITTAQHPSEFIQNLSNISISNANITYSNFSNGIITNSTISNSTIIGLVTQNQTVFDTIRVNNISVNTTTNIQLLNNLQCYYDGCYLYDSSKKSFIYLSNSFARLRYSQSNPYIQSNINVAPEGFSQYVNTNTTGNSVNIHTDELILSSLNTTTSERTYQTMNSTNISIAFDTSENTKIDISEGETKILNKLNPSELELPSTTTGQSAGSISYSSATESIQIRNSSAWNPYIPTLRYNYSNKYPNERTWAITYTNTNPYPLFVSIRTGVNKDDATDAGIIIFWHNGYEILDNVRWSTSNTNDLSIATFIYEISPYSNYSISNLSFGTTPLYSIYEWYEHPKI